MWRERRTAANGRRTCHAIQPRSCGGGGKGEASRAGGAQCSGNARGRRRSKLPRLQLRRRRAAVAAAVAGCRAGRPARCQRDLCRQKAADGMADVRAQRGGGRHAGHAAEPAANSAAGSGAAAAGVVVVRRRRQSMRRRRRRRRRACRRHAGRLLVLLLQWRRCAAVRRVAVVQLGCFARQTAVGRGLNLHLRRTKMCCSGG